MNYLRAFVRNLFGLCCVRGCKNKHTHKIIFDKGTIYMCQQHTKKYRSYLGGNKIVEEDKRNGQIKNERITLY